MTQQLGVPPSHVVVAHPASYGPYKLDLLQQAARQAELTSVSFVSEPVAAAVHYASLEQVPVPGWRSRNRESRRRVPRRDVTDREGNGR